jgi:hypothetical protein
MRSKDYVRRERNYLAKGVVVLLLATAICYYSFVGAKCIRHWKSLMQNRSTTINMLTGGE